jgi:hypothetical protein
MPISWDEFEAMFASVTDGLAQLRAMAHEHDPAQRDEYDALAKRIMATSRDITSSTGIFTPPISQPKARERWQDVRREANAIANLVRTNRGSWWQGE